jgi:hypothetical protein
VTVGIRDGVVQLVYLMGGDFFPQVTITGLYFGPLGGALIDSVYLGSAECADPLVTEEDTTLVCEVGSATQTDLGGDFSYDDLCCDGRMDAVVTIGGQDSGASSENAFAFSQCEVSHCAL